MPSRVIREGILDSERYWSVTIEARELYWHLLLLADDFGCVSLAPVFVRRRCFNDGPADEMVDKLLEQLLGADLVRMYEVAGARYGFIPRFRQRLQRMTLKHPAPPVEMLNGDDDAQQKFEKVQAGNRKSNGSTSAGQQMPTVAHPPKGREVEVESKRREERQIRAAAPLPEWLNIETWNAYVKNRPAKARTPEALAAALTKLEGFRAAGHDANEIVATSLANGWHGLFEPRAKGGQPQQAAPAKLEIGCGNCGATITGGWSQSAKGRVCDECYHGYMNGGWPVRAAA